MNLKDIEKLIRIVEKSNINQFKIEEDGIKVEIVKDDIKQNNIVMHSPMMYQEARVQQQASVAQPDVVEVVADSKKISDSEIAVVSPMVGTFYASPSPESPAFVSVGSKIRKGDPVCIIEAMKLFNEIESEYDGKVVQILVKNSDPIEFGQPLFILKKDA